MYIGLDKKLFPILEPSKPSKVLPIIIAKAKTKLYMGKGIDFYCEDEKVMKKWKEFAELNCIYDFINNQQKAKSISGVAIVSINKLKDGRVILNNINPYVGPTQITYCFSTPEVVCIVEQIELASRPIYMRSVYTKELVVRRFWVSSDPHIFKGTKFEAYNESYKINEVLPTLDLGKYDERSDC